MAKDLAVLIIHGMGRQEKDFAKGITEELKRRIVGSERIAWQPVRWAEALTKKQEDFLGRATLGRRLYAMFLRRFVVHYLGDPTAYRWVGPDPGTAYGEIHRTVRDAVKAVFEVELERQPTPLAVLAHSLGGHIISNYIWDIQHKQEIVSPGANSFERLDTLRALVTFGCNIPLFTFALNDVVPIKLPDGAQWFNYYDPDDVLSYPLQPVSDAFRATVTADIPVNVGNFLTGWNPLSHNGYWTDKDFLDPVAELLSGLLP